MSDPTISGLNASVSFSGAAVNAAAQLLDADGVTLTYAGANLNGGTLRVVGLRLEDIVGIRNQGTGAGQIGITGSTITYGGVAIGTFSGGVGVPLVVHLNTAAATAAAVEALVENLTYRTLDPEPHISRTLAIYLTDAAGGHYDASSFTSQPDSANPFLGLGTGANGLPRNSNSPAFADVDGDGDLDVVLGQGQNSGVTYLRNDGGTFVKPAAGQNSFAGVNVASGDTVRLSMGDVDGDGDSDLIIPDQGTGTLRFFRNGTAGTAGTFTELTGAQNPFTVVTNPAGSSRQMSTHLVDWDGDGDADLIYAVTVYNSDGFGSFVPTTKVSYYRNGTTGATGAFQTLPVGQDPFAAIDFSQFAITPVAVKPVTVDVDGDGDLDLLFTGSTTSDHLLYYRNGTTGSSGAFTLITGAQNPFNSIDLGSSPTLAFGDVDGDGDLDILDGTAVSGQLVYFKNNAAGAGFSVQVNLTGVDDSPIAGDDSLHAFINSSAIYTQAQLLLNDTDSDAARNSQTLTVQSVGSAVNGAVVLNANSTITFTPTPGFAGLASFTYVVSDGAGGTDTGLVNVTVPPLDVILPVDLTFLNQPEGITISGVGSRAYTGMSVSDAGDVNGDGFDDFMFSAPHAGAGLINGNLDLGSPHRVYVVYGKTSGLADMSVSNISASNGFVIDGGFSGYIPVQVSSAGDFNKDGFDDILVSVQSSPSYSLGSTFLIFGKAGGLSNIDLSSLAPSAGFKIFHNTFDYFGRSVSGAGDVNGDGYADIVIGAPYSPHNNESSPPDGGDAYVIFGKGSGFGTIDVASMSAAQGFRIFSPTIGDHMGVSVSSAGDINKDGYADIIIGGDGVDNGSPNQPLTAGKAYVVFGKASGFGTVNVTTMAASAGFALIGPGVGSGAGFSVSTAGDINGDGYDDIIVGAPYSPNVANGNYGKAYVVFGKAGGFGTINLSTLAAPNGFTIGSNIIFGYQGFSVSAAGDFNGDGFDDMIVGAPNRGLQDNGGGAYLIFGRASGFPANIELFNIAQENGFQIIGDSANDRAGFSVSGAGDVNGDGYADLIIGAPQDGDDQGSTIGDQGAVYVLFGHATTLNTPPTAVDDVFSTTEDTPITIQASALLGNDSDLDGDTLTLQSVSGAAVLNLDGSVTFTPVPNFFGAATFTYVVSDGIVTDSGLVTVNVSAVPDEPMAGDDSLSITDKFPLTIGFSTLLGNDSDPDGTAVTISGVTSGLGGVATIDLANQTITFSRDLGFYGAATFTYSLEDGNGGSAIGHVTVTTTFTNSVPVAAADLLNAGQNTPTDFASSLITGNDENLDGDTLVITGLTSGTGGTATLNLDGSVHFEPDQDFLGQATFTYTVSDGDGGTDTGSVTVDVQAPPDAVADSLNGTEDTALTISINDDLLANDTAAAGKTLSYQGFGNVTGGNMVDNSDGTLTFTPSPNFNGDATFDYTVSDGALNDTTTVTIHVASVLDPINAADDSFISFFSGAHEDQPKTIFASNLLSNDTGEGTLLVQSVNSGTGGSVSLDVNGNVLFTPTANFNGLATFTYILADANGTDTGTVTVKVFPGYDAPIAVDDTFYTLQDTPVSFSITNDVLANDIDPNNEGIGFEYFEAPSSGDLQDSGDGDNFIFTPDSGFHGIVHIDYWIYNNDDETIGTVNIIVDALPVLDLNGAAAGNDNSASYAIGSPGAVLAPLLLASDSDDPALQSVTVIITSGLRAEDVLAIAGSPPGAIIGVGADFFSYDYDSGAGTLILTGPGPVASFQELLRQITFSTTAVSPGSSRTIAWTASDGISDGAPHETTLALITDLAPVLDLDGNDNTAAGTNYAASYAEGGSAASISDTDVSITDADAGDDVVSATITITNAAAGDKLTATGLPAGISIDVTSTDTMLKLVGTGTQAQYQTAIAGVTFSSSSDNPTAYGSNTSRTINVTVNDGDLNSNVATSTVTVTAINDAPVNNVGGSIGTGEDAVDAWMSGMSISDPDANPATSPMTVTFTVGHGKLKIDTSLVGGIQASDIVGGANNSATITVTTTLNKINFTLAANNGLTYSPTVNYNGPDSLTVTTSDGGATGNDPGISGTGTLSNEQDQDVRAITVSAVADAPTGADATKATNEDTAYYFTASDFGFSDPADGNSFVKVEITTLPAGTIYLDDDGAGGPNAPVAVTLGQQIDVQYLDGRLYYVPPLDVNGAGAAHFTFKVIDNGDTSNGGSNIDSTARTFTFDVNALNDDPTVDLNGAGAGTSTSIAYTEGQGFTLIAPAGTVSDPDGGNFGGGVLTVTITNSISSDHLSIKSQGTGIGQYSSDEGGIYYNFGHVDANNDPVGPELVATYSGASDGADPLIITLTDKATASTAQGILELIGYQNFGNDPGTSRTVTFVLTDGDGGTSPTAIATINVTSISDPAVANDDEYFTDENTAISGNVFQGAGADYDPDGPTLKVAAVNGQASKVGVPFVLPSGAILTLNEDGSFTFDPHGAWNSLTDTDSGETGAVNTTGVDSFTYTLVGGGTATVKVTIDGLLSPEDVLAGDNTNNVITGTPNNDLFMLQQGGDDEAYGLGGNDVFYYGGALTAQDKNDGGAGRDVVVLQGNYNLTLGANNLVNIEALSLQSGTVTRWGGSGNASYDYNITTVNANVPAATLMIVNASNLVLGEDFTFNGSAETDGSFLIYAGGGKNDLTGGALKDVFFFEGNWSADDRVNGGGGQDAVIITGGSTVNQIFISAGALTNVEAVSVSDYYASNPGATPSYEMILEDGNVIAGGRLIVNGNSLTLSTQYFSLDAHTVTGNLDIYGGNGTDTFKSGSGSDLLYGGGGADALTGGAGADKFQYRDISESTTTAADHILDFSTGTDKIDLSYIDANTTQAGDQAFTLSNDGTFHNSAGELRSNWDAGNGWFVVEGDVNGDGIADFAIHVTTVGATPLASSDFLL